MTKADDSMRYKERHKAAGLCVGCQNVAIEGRSLCVRCRDKQRARQNELQQLRRLKGLCLSCGRETSGTLYCDLCKSKQKEANKKQRDAFRANGKCLVCGNDLTQFDTGKVTCMACILKVTDNRRRRL